jgi:hypothetical protein
MVEPFAFRRGSDLGEATSTEARDTVGCVDCGAIATDEQAFESGWQLAPPVCPACLRWTLTDAGERCCAGGA